MDSEDREEILTENQRLLKLLGYRGKNAATPEQVKEYKRIFKKVDENGDGKLTLEEYATNSRFRDEKKVRGIFNAADRDGDGIVTEEDHVENRIITEQAKEIFREMDENGDGIVTEREFVMNALIADKDLTREIFRKMDEAGAGELTLPRYLRV
jgi:Ca2+-binding EF-hand superfamily protein